MNKILLSLMLVICLPLVVAIPDRAVLVDMVTDEIVNLEFDTGLTQSYHDDPTRHDIKVRVFSDNNLEEKWVCLLYKVGNSFIEITASPETFTRCAKLHSINNENFFDTPDSIKIDDTKGKYPAILYAAISEDKNVDLSDTFIQLNPETDGWLVGADGGAPCMGSEGLWIYVPEDCNIEKDADPVYDSFDITVAPYQNEVGITVDAAYYPVSEMSAAEIPTTFIKVVVGIGTSLENILDSAAIELDKEVKLNYGSYRGKLNVYVNGIKEGELIINADGTPSTGESGAGAAKESFWDGSTEGKLKWVFPIDYALSVTEITLYLKEPMTTASLMLNTLDKEELEGKIYDYLSPSSSFEQSNIASVYVKFKIPRQWMHNKFLLQDMIFLNYRDNGWKSATVYLFREDQEYYYFISRMDNLYDFNIGEQIGELVILPEEELVKIGEIKKEFQIENLLWLVLILLILTLLILFTRKKKKKKVKK